jgi:hypothetical protein
VTDPLGVFKIFPHLANGGYRVSSASTSGYNCIAWAAARDDRWWWPHPDGFWPPEAPLSETLEAFEAAFASLGYVRCIDYSLERRYEKIAIYASTAGIPTHAARQLATGRWTSKLGHSEDIEHSSPDALISNNYGAPALLMRRRLGVFRFALHWFWAKFGRA